MNDRDIIAGVAHAILVEGPLPHLHIKEMTHLRKKWPALYRATAAAVQSHQTDRPSCLVCNEAKIRRTR